MLLQNIKIENFKSFKENVSLNNLKGLTVLIGPNGAGKSNVLFAIQQIKNSLAGNEIIFDEIVFDKNTDAIITIEIIFELTNQERQYVIDKLAIKDEQIRTDIDISKTTFMKNLFFKFQISSKGIISEQLSFTSINNEIILYIDAKVENNNLQYDVKNLGVFFKSGTSLNQLQNTQTERVVSTGLNFKLFDGFNGNKFNIFFSIFLNFFNGIKYFNAERNAKFSLQWFPLR